MLDSQIVVRDMPLVVQVEVPQVPRGEAVGLQCCLPLVLVLVLPGGGGEGYGG